MQEPEIIINLDLPPSQRWAFLVDYASEINELIQCYLNDFQGAEYLFGAIGSFKHAVIASEYLEEIEFIASISKFTADEVLVANLYYDVLKFYFGCTAFAVESEGKMLHARNLDWWTDNNLLSRHSKIFAFQKQGQTVFKSVGWVGFVGVLSGVKPGKFSITLNAVLSKDQPEIAIPISFFIRDVLATANSFDEAKAKLENTTIASDCLLLLAGAQTGEMAVIERTPTRSATRNPERHFITVTNDYKLIENIVGESELQSTSCGRYDRAVSLLNQSTPQTTADCLAILQDENVMMGITVQQMVFHVATGEVELIKTENSGWI